MKDWFRNLPHFGYGKCGGKNKDCSPRKPIDWMDEAFKQHDIDLFNAKNQDEKNQADIKLYESLKNGDKTLLTWKGRIYCFFAKIIFKPKRGLICSQD